MIRIKITEKKVQEFLENNPDYFINNEEILDKMNFPQILEKVHKSKNVISFKKWLYDSLKNNYRQVIENAEHNFFTQKVILSLVLKIVKVNKIEKLKDIISNDICSQLDLDCFFLISSSKKIKKFGGYFLEKKCLSDICKTDGQLIMDAANEKIPFFKNLSEKITSNAIYSLDSKIFGDQLLIVFGSKDRIFLKNRGTDLIIFFGNIFQEKLRQLVNE